MLSWRTPSAAVALEDSADKSVVNLNSAAVALASSAESAAILADVSVPKSDAIADSADWARSDSISMFPCKVISSATLSLASVLILDWSTPSAAIALVSSASTSIILADVSADKSEVNFVSAAIALVVSTDKSEVKVEIAESTVVST